MSKEFYTFNYESPDGEVNISYVFSPNFEAGTHPKVVHERFLEFLEGVYGWDIRKAVLNE